MVTLLGIKFLSVETVTSFADKLLPYLGIPGTMMALAIWALVSGKIVAGREAADLKCQHEKDIEEWRQRYDRDVEEWRTRLEAAIKEKDDWKRMALENMRALEIATKTVEKSASVIERKAKQ